MTGHYGYIAFYRNQRYELHAETLYYAKLKAVNHFKPPKSQQHMVSVMLAEVDGKPVVHTAT